MDNLAYQLANGYVNLKIGKTSVRIPYAITKNGLKKNGIENNSQTPATGRFENYAGKGSPKQIQELLIASAKRENFPLPTATSEQIFHFMEMNAIGIDCSGFVYNVLDAFLQKIKNKKLDTIILRYPGLLGKIERFLLQKNRVRRSNANTLTSNLNTIKVEKVKDIQIADMIRLTHADWKGKHIAIIVGITKTYIIYAMTSEYTKIKGSHFGKIKIVNKEKNLQEQEWEEVTKDGKNYGKDAFDPKRGDSVRRLKYLFV